MFGTKIYKYFAIRKIKKIKEHEKRLGHTDVKAALSSMGGVSRTTIVIILVLFFFSYMAASYQMLM